MPIAELFLGALLPVLFERLASPELLNFARHEGIDTLLEKWKVMLTSINEVLDDAEDRQLTGHGGVKSWLEDLRNLAYDIDDLLDEFTIKSAENKSKAEPSTSKAHALLPSCCFGLSPRTFIFDRKMRSKMEEMDGRLQAIKNLQNTLNLKENVGRPIAYGQPNKPDSTTNLKDIIFVSREEEKMKILKLLSREEDDSTCADSKVIAIIGMGGVGKTALTQQVYNDASLSFDEKAWACVSDNFNMLSITKSILETTNPSLSCEGKTLNWLQDELKKNLSGKKFLIVLDDYWNEKYEDWTTLSKPFQFGAKGSKIIVTTRHLKVAKTTGATSINLEVLSTDDSVNLFVFHALGVQNFDDHPELEEVGKEIVAKCKGLPLAVKTVAGLLRFQVSRQEWEVILNSRIWNISEENILPALKLSYLHLPPHLRRCFAYCAILPEDYEIKRDELIHWWIAEGLVKGKQGKDRWDAGLEYFNELVFRSLFQKSSSSESLFLMHDLVNNLAKVVAGATHFRLGDFEFEGNQKIASLVRHASFISNRHIVSKKLKIYHGMKRLKSFISFSSQSFLSQNVLCDLLSALEYLRVLSLSHYKITEVPESIGKLRHLRHLNLSYTCIKMLPKSIVALYNLEALMLRGCRDLLELPKGIANLINLRFLDIIDTPSLKAMPLHVGNLVGLEMLSKFIVGTGNGSRLKELKNLENLRGELCIFDLHKVQEVEDANDANDANLCMKKGIYWLTMQWSVDFEISRNIELEGRVLNFLRPHQNLKNLTISYYGGLEFPSWLGNPSYVNIVCLHLHGCRGVKELPLLGHLRSLEALYIEGLNSMCTVGSEFYGSNNPFPSLLTLEFKSMPLWEDWSHCIDTEEVGVVFPHLNRLVIQDCPKLKAWPSFISLPSLYELEFKGCIKGVLQSLVSSTSLTALTINYVVDLTCLNHGFTSSLIKLEKLEIRGCKQLRYLWQDGDAIRNLDCLKRLVVHSCPKFIYCVAEEGDIELPGNLETIELIQCDNLEKLPSTLHTLSSLRDLIVHDCPKLVSFPTTDIPTSTISLNINDCEMLQSLPGRLSAHLDEPCSSSRNTRSNIISCPQDLRISGCNSLPSSPFSGVIFLPTTLRRLNIYFCKGVESLAEINLDPLQSLQEIFISHCENLRSLPQGVHTLSQLTVLELRVCPALEVECFPPLPLGISKFSLWECPKIKSLPNQLHRVTSLQTLIIRECESITHFPDGGLPLQLQELELIGCKNMNQLARDWLILLPSLQGLWIDGSVGGVGEEENLVLPPLSSLLHLKIYRMGKVERLSSSLPPSLQNLWISKCPKLRELPQDGLPPSLEELWIRECGILEERCRKGTGNYWPLIREIPQVTLGDCRGNSIT